MMEYDSTMKSGLWRSCRHRRTLCTSSSLSPTRDVNSSDALSSSTSSSSSSSDCMPVDAAATAAASVIVDDGTLRSPDVTVGAANSFSVALQQRDGDGIVLASSVVTGAPPTNLLMTILEHRCALPDAATTSTTMPLSTTSTSSSSFSTSSSSSSTTSSTSFSCSIRSWSGCCCCTMLCFWWLRTESEAEE
uniref:Uncharacterized protein n=1 Tax=Triticum urartu TaxID=4572 RepID=A0A8R7UE19_TRIUA